MKRLITFTIILTLLFVIVPDTGLILPVYAPPSGWLGYYYRQAISINQTTGLGTNYVANFTIHSGIGSSSGYTLYLNNSCYDFPKDIRFTKSDGVTLIDFWFYNLWQDPAQCYVEVPDDLSTANRSIYIYYGNVSVSSSASSVVNTFTFPGGSPSFDRDTNYDVGKITQQDPGNTTSFDGDEGWIHIDDDWAGYWFKGWWSWDAGSIACRIWFIRWRDTDGGTWCKLYGSNTSGDTPPASDIELASHSGSFTITSDGGTCTARYAKACIYTSNSNTDDPYMWVDAAWWGKSWDPLPNTAIGNLERQPGYWYYLHFYDEVSPLIENPSTVRLTARNASGALLVNTTISDDTDLSGAGYGMIFIFQSPVSYFAMNGTRRLFAAFLTVNFTGGGVTVYDFERWMVPPSWGASVNAYTITIHDYTNTYKPPDAYIRASRSVLSTSYFVDSDEIPYEASTTLYLYLNLMYSLTVQNSAGSTRSFGPIQANTDYTKEIIIGLAMPTMTVLWREFTFDVDNNRTGTQLTVTMDGPVYFDGNVSIVAKFSNGTRTTVYTFSDTNKTHIETYYNYSGEEAVWEGIVCVQDVDTEESFCQWWYEGESIAPPTPPDRVPTITQYVNQSVVQLPTDLQNIGLNNLITLAAGIIVFGLFATADSLHYGLIGGGAIMMFCYFFLGSVSLLALVAASFFIGMGGLVAFSKR